MREGAVTALDTKTALTVAGSDTAPGPLAVPQGKKFITEIDVSAIQNMAAATGYSAFCRLEGPGMVNGPESIVIGAGGNNVATGGNGVAMATKIKLNFPVQEANEIQFFAEMAGTDIGALGVQIGVVFSDVVGEGAAEHKTMTLEGDVTAVNTRTALLTQGSVASPSKLVPAGYNKIDKIIVAAGCDGLADGKANIFLRLGGNAVLGGEQLIPIASVGRIAVQSGSDSAPQICRPLVLEDLDIDVSPSDTISAWAEMGGDDCGTTYVACTLVFAKK